MSNIILTDDEPMSSSLEHRLISLENIALLPDDIKNILRQHGINKLRDFQVEAIKSGLKGESLIISAPTGAGKTLIGEILALIKIIKEKRKVLFLVPYKALAEEQYSTLKSRYNNIRVGISTGDYREMPSSKLGYFYDLIVMTYEKADMLLRERPLWFSEIGLLVVDEIHLIDDIDRGAILDALITRFRRLNVQIIALSATISNADDLASWIGARLIKSNIRPVKLIEGVYLSRSSGIYFYDPRPDVKEYIYVEEKSKPKEPRKNTLLDFFNRPTTNQELTLEEKIEVPGLKIKRVSTIVSKTKIIYERKRKDNELTAKLKKLARIRGIKGVIFLETIQKAPYRERGLLKYILDMVYDLLIKSKELGTTWQILIFRRSRQLSQKTAEKIANMMMQTELYKLFPEGKEVAEELLNKVDEISPLTEILANVAKYGVGFHHAGLTREERKIVENAFRNRKIGVIVATPTLGAGINLPARRVVVEHLVYEPLYGMRKISVSKYKQRGGRAGRPGYDTVGESILIAKSKDEVIDLFRTYIFGNPEPVTSKLGAYLPQLRKQVLATIVMEKGITEEDIFSFFLDTFYAWLANKRNDYLALYQLKENVFKGISELEKWNFVKREDNKLVASDLGKKISLLYLDPLTAKILIEFLNKMKKKGIKKLNPDEIFYILTKTPDIENFKLRLLQNTQMLATYILRQYLTFKTEFSSILSYDKISLLNEIAEEGIGLLPEEEEELSSLGIVAILIQWINLKHVKDILDPLSPGFSGGDLRELAGLVEWLLYCTKELASLLELSPDILMQLDVLRRRVEHGVTEDLLSLVSIPGIGRVRASMLKKYGYDSLEKLARADISTLMEIPGIGEVLARRIIEFAKKHLASKSLT